MNLKNRRKISKKKKVLWLFVMVLFCTILLLIAITKKLNPILEKYSSLETKRLATIFVHYAVDQVDVEDIEDIFVTTKNDEGQIQAIDFDAVKVNKLLEEVSNQVQDVLINVENGNIKDMKLSRAISGQHYKNIKKGVVCEVTVGTLLGSSLFANLGPRIPIKWNFVGQVTTKLSTKIKEYGINNVYLEVNIHIEVTERITMPITTKEEVIKVDIPIGIKVIQGSIPNFYNGSLIKESGAFSLPIEE